MKRLLLCLLLVAGSVSGQVRRDSLRVSALDLLAISSTDALITTARVNRIIDEAVREVSANFPAIEKLDTVVIYTTTEGGALASDFSQAWWAQIMVDDSVRIPLTYREPDTLYEARGGSDGVSDAGKNVTQQRYYYTHAGRLMLYSKYGTGEGDSLFVLLAYYAVDDAMSADTTTTSISDAYRAALMDWICYRIEMLRFRFDAATVFAVRYDKAKAEARPGK